MSGGATGPPTFLDKIDIVFACDRSESMLAYNTALQSHINSTLHKLKKNTESEIQVSLVAYGAQNSPVHTFDFTSSWSTVDESISQQIIAAKEPSTDAQLPKKSIDQALATVANLQFSSEATTKIVFFLLDAAPLALTEVVGAENDIVKAARTLLEKGVLLYLVADGNRLGDYGFQPQWIYKAICELTGGRFVQLYDSTEVCKLVLYAGQEEVSLGQFAEEIRITHEAVCEELKDQKSLEEQLEIVTSKLTASGLKLQSFGISRIDVEEEEERAGVKALKECQDIAAVRALLPKLTPPNPVSEVIHETPPKASSGTIRKKAKAAGKKNKKSVIEVVLSDDGGARPEESTSGPSSPRSDSEAQAPQVPDFDLDEKQAAMAFEKSRKNINGGVIFKETGTSEAIYQKKAPITLAQVRRVITRTTAK